MSDNPTAEERKCLTGHKVRDECPTKKQMGNRANKEDRVLMCVRQLVSYIRVPIWTRPRIIRQQTICKVNRVLAIRSERWSGCCPGVKSIFANAFVLTWKIGKWIPCNAKRWCERFVFDDCWRKESQFFQFRSANWLRIIEGRVAEIEKKSASRTDWCTP